jgi:cysteine desulfurase / selenocysteine lyase
VLKVAPIDDAGELDLDEFARLIGSRTKLIAVTHVANALGTVLPVEAVTRLAKMHGIPAAPRLRSTTTVMTSTLSSPA